jgi:hypothetical protein
MLFDKKPFPQSVSPLVVSAMLAVAISMLAGWASVGLSEAYYAVAPFHYDSASYRLEAIRLYDLLNSTGLASAVKASFLAKDGLDLTMRLLFAPNSLVQAHGHLAVLLPFMAGFVFLQIHYTFKHTQSFQIALIVSLSLMSFPLIYDPYKGIADYWKDNLAVWLLGSALLSWLLSQNLTHRRWAFVSGLMLGLLVMQRSALGVYALVLFLPPVVLAAYQRWRSDTRLDAMAGMAAFALPAGLLGLTVVSLQWQSLYQYYFVRGYAYTSPLQVASFLVAWLKDVSGIPQLLFGIVFAIFAIGTEWKRKRLDLGIVIWFVVGLPLVVIGTSSLYNGFMDVWSVLLVTLLAVLATPGTLGNRRGALLLSAIALIAVAIQYDRSERKSQQQATINYPFRLLYDQIVNVVMAQPSPRHVSLVFEETGSPFFNHARFNRNVTFKDPINGFLPIGFMSVHDTYYRAGLGDLSIQQYYEISIRSLEANDGTLVVASCSAEDVLVNPAFGPDGKKIAVPVAILTHNHLLQSLHWKVISRLDSPRGCLYVLRYSKAQMTPTDKWSGLAYGKGVEGIPVTLNLAPSVKLLNYKGRYQAEYYNGNWVQWLPSGSPGLRLDLLSDRARKVRLLALATPGPSRKDGIRTLEIREGEKVLATKQVMKGENIDVPFELHSGMNSIDLISKEAVDGVVASGDRRELMLLLSNPRLLE